MIIEHQGQALTVAMEMERRAIRTYERALLLAKDEEVRKGIEDILSDERRHLKRFTECGTRPSIRRNSRCFCRQWRRMCCSAAA